MKPARRYKLKGSSILEPLIATTILIISTTAFSVLITDIVGWGNGRIKCRAMASLTEVKQLTKTGKKFIDETMEYSDFTIQKNISKYRDSENLYVLKVAATDSKGETIAEQNEIIFISK